jgi:hypothetical protein
MEPCAHVLTGLRLGYISADEADAIKERGCPLCDQELHLSINLMSDEGCPNDGPADVVD